MPFFALAVWVLFCTIFQSSHAIDLNVKSTASIKKAASTMAYGLMSWYENNATDTPASAVGIFPAPLYWWESGAIWGGMIDYWAYTGDNSYNPTVMKALLAQAGPNNNFMDPAYYSSLGNDDQLFWAITALNAHQYGFPTPPNRSPKFWLELTENAFNSIVPRWFTGQCNGGLQWQVFQSNPGWGYKNSVSNGGLFQVAARLAKITGNQTYIHWSEKVWDWMEGVGFIGKYYSVFDGAEAASNCSNINHDLWSYNPSMLLYGTAVLYNHTKSEIWLHRTSGLLTACANTFFGPYPNSSHIMYERRCEPQDDCTTDQLSFKAYLSRWMAQSAALVPALKNTVRHLLRVSAKAAAQSCSGGARHTTCGTKWYVGGYDGNYGPGQQLSALETVQALLLLRD